MNVTKLVVRFVFVLFLAACGGGSTTDETVSVASSEQRMKALAATDTSSLDQTSTGFYPREMQWCILDQIDGSRANNNSFDGFIEP